MNSNPVLLNISLAQQHLTLFYEKESGAREAVFSAPISSALNGIGFQKGSYQTPTGRFCVAQKIGLNAPPQTLFKGRQPLHIWQPNHQGEDPILSRIIRLEGLDPQNQNTWDRYIYLHGTHEEHLIGRPASHGCIRLRNDDIITLCDHLPLGAFVSITESVTPMLS